MPKANHERRELILTLARTHSIVEIASLLGIARSAVRGMITTAERQSARDMQIARAAQLHNKGRGLFHELCHAAGLAPTTARTRAKELGLTIKRAPSTRKREQTETADRTLRAYAKYLEGMTFREIGQHFAVSGVAVQQWFRAANLMTVSRLTITDPDARRQAIFKALRKEAARG